MTTKGSLVLTSCSDARKEDDRPEIDQLSNVLKNQGWKVIESRYLYDDDAHGREKAEELSSFFNDGNVKGILDVSGGNVANELLGYLDYDAIGKSDALFVGYSDLTTIINAIYAKTGKASLLYQARHLVGNEVRQREFFDFLKKVSECENNEASGSAVDSIEYRFIQGNELCGTLIGGNLRCFLKLAGTEYMPDVKDKILLMEALGGDIYSVRTMLVQLSQLGIFDNVRGIVVGTFTALIREGLYDSFLKLLLSYVPEDIPVAVTGDIGHDRNAKGIVVGGEISEERKDMFKAK